MEDFNQIKLLHEKVQSDIFRILEQYNIVAHVSTTLHSRVPLYFITEDYKFLFYELPAEVSAYISSINRLLETHYIQIVVDPFSEQSFFIKTNDLEKLKDPEPDHYIAVPEKALNVHFEKRSRVSFLDGIL